MAFLLQEPPENEAAFLPAASFLLHQTI